VKGGQPQPRLTLTLSAYVHSQIPFFNSIHPGTIIHTQGGPRWRECSWKREPSPTSKTSTVYILCIFYYKIYRENDIKGLNGIFLICI
jgi:hypothetical protein